MDEKRGSVSHAYNRRLAAAKENRHASTVSALQRAMDEGVNVLQAEELSEEDKRLAEMGYVQVSVFTNVSSHRLTPHTRCTSASSLGYHVSRSPSPSPDYSPVLQPLSSTHSKQAVPLQQSGAG